MSVNVSTTESPPRKFAIFSATFHGSGALIVRMWLKSGEITAGGSRATPSKLLNT